MLNQSEINTSQTTNPIPTMKKELPKKSKLPMYLGLALVVIVAFAGIGISLRQFLVRESVAPTAPGESQASIDKIQDCSVSFDVAPPETGISCTKQAYRDELSNTAGEYELTQTQNTFAPGETIVYNFTVTNTGEQETIITATDSLNINIADDVFFSYNFLDSDCGVDAYQDRTITCVSDSLLPGESQDFTFRIELSEQINTDITLTNNVQITDGTLNEECSVDVKIDSPTEASCNEACSANVECTGENQSCIEGLCRLDQYPDSETCEEPEPTPSPSPSPSVSPSPSPETVAYCGDYCNSNSDCIQNDQICYFNQCRLADYPDRNDCTIPPKVVTTTYVEPTPTIGCNEGCLTNRDCSNNDHICFEGNCRLASYPASTSCTVPVAQVNPAQPKMPEELPQSGSDDLINWIKAGIGILGAGALLLLL